MSHHWELFLEDADGARCWWRRRRAPSPSRCGASSGEPTPRHSRRLAHRRRPGRQPRSIPLAPGTRFAWRLTIDGESLPGASLGFTTRPRARRRGRDRLRPAVRPLPGGLRPGRRLPALARQDDHRVRRPPVLHDHDEPPPAAYQRVVRRARDRAGQNVVVGQPRLLARAGHERPRRQRFVHRQPRGRVALHRSPPSTATPSTPRRGCSTPPHPSRGTTVASWRSRPRPSTSAAKRSATSGASSWSGRRRMRRRASGPTATTSGTEPSADRTLRFRRRVLGVGRVPSPGPAVAPHPRPLGRAGLRGDAAADTSGAGRALITSGSWGRVPDARPCAGRSGRGRAAVVRARVTTGPPCPCTGPPVALVERARQRRPRHEAALLPPPRRRRLHGARVRLVRLRRRRGGRRHQRSARAVPLRLPERRSAPRRRRDSATASSRRGESWEFNQAVFDLGATVCTGSPPSLRLRPLRRQCLLAPCRATRSPTRGGPGRGARTQGTFAGSDRQGRGRLIEGLRQGTVAPDELARACGWPDDAARAQRTAAALVAEGFARWSRGRLTLA